MLKISDGRAEMKYEDSFNSEAKHGLISTIGHPQDYSITNKMNMIIKDKNRPQCSTEGCFQQ